MRTALLLLLFTTATAYAQLDSGGLHNPDAPKAERYFNYVNDEQRSRKEFEAAAKAMLSPKFRTALAKFEPGDASDLIPTWGEFITAIGTEFVALQLALPSNPGLRANTQYTFFGLISFQRETTLKIVE